MKRFFCIFLALLTLAASPALAQVLTIDLDTATIEELTAAQAQIGDRISQLRAAAAPAGEAIVLTGSGTSIISGVDVVAVPARLTIEGTVKLTLSGKFDYTFNQELHPYNCAVITGAETFDAMVEGTGDWTITIEPIKEGGSIVASGVGPWVSDYFPLEGPAILTVKADGSGMDALMSNVIVQLYQPLRFIGTYNPSSLTNALITATGDAFAADVIAKPDDGTPMCFWYVKVAPGVAWSIELQ